MYSYNMHTTCQHHAKLFNLQNSHRISILFPISPSTRPPPQATELTHLPNTNPMRAKDTGHRDDSPSPSLPICQVKTGQGFHHPSWPHCPVTEHCKWTPVYFRFEMQGHPLRKDSRPQPAAKPKDLKGATK